jgi:site-specific DNA-methyltransferase (adenine-specific)
LITLVKADCIDILRQMPDRSVDAIVTDPPFGIGFQYAKGKETCSNASDYWAWFEPFFKEMVRVTTPGGLLAVWQTQLYFKNFWGWYGDDIHIYAACKNFVQLRKTPVNYAYDPVILKYLPGAVPNRPEKPKRNTDFFVSNTAALVSQTKRLERQHPCPRPLDVVSQIVENFTKAGSLVFDPFMGSGTTGLACKQAGRDFLGIERDQGYFDLAMRRISEGAKLAA